MNDTPLAGVPATRLLPLTEHLAKPAVPLLGRPLIGHPLIHLYAAGCTEVHVNAHHQAERLITTLDAWVQRRLLRMRLHWSVERPAILGTGGAIRLLESALCESGGPLLLLNGDSVLGMDLPALWEAHQRHRELGAVATLLCVPRPDAARYGAVRVDGEGRILDLAGLGRRPGAKDEAIEAATPTIFCGVQIMEPSVVASLPPAGTESCIVRQGYVPLLEAGHDVRAFLAPSDLIFHDAGTPDRYLDAQAELMDANTAPVLPASPGVDPWEALFQEAVYAVDGRGREYGNPDSVTGLGGAKIHGPVFFGPRNTVEAGAVIGPHASIGALNHIGAGARIEDCALWSGVEVAPGEHLTGLLAAKFGGKRLLARGREN